MNAIRNKRFQSFYQESIESVKSLNIDPIFEMKRKRKVQRLFDYEADYDIQLNEIEDIFHNDYMKAIDNIIEQFEWIFEKVTSVFQDFDFFTDSNSLLLSEVNCLNILWIFRNYTHLI